MNTKQITAIFAPILLLAFMFPVFRLLARRYGNKNAWYCGLIIYWVIWGITYPLLWLDPQTVLSLIQPQSFDLITVLLASIPVAFAAVGRFGLGMRYEKESTWAFFGLLGTALGNGFFEEIIWRGTYLELFPESILFRIVWPSLWFGLWHFAPGSVSGNTARNLVIASVFFGLLLSLIASYSGTIWWSILSHTLAGIIMVIWESL